MNSSYDFLVIGGGSGGHAAASRAVKLGLSCALIEGGDTLGGLCILRGCMPSKTLIESANRLREIRDAARFGLRVEGAATPDEKAIHARLKHLSKDFLESRQHDMHTAGYTLLRGTAAFLSSHEVEFRPRDGSPAQTLTARSFLIATGSEPSIPEIEGLADTSYWTSDDVVKLPPLPKSVIVLGGGAIGMECAHLFEGLGAQVTVVIRSGRILREFDPDLSTAMEKESEERGIRFLREAKVTRVRYDGARFTVETDSSPPIFAEALLVATGRKPRTQGMEASGVEMKKGRIVIDRHAATSQPHIFAAGDCASPEPVVHLAAIQGEAAARNAARLLHGTGEPAEWQPESAMVALFTEPQAMKIGPSEDELRKQGYDPVSGRQNYYEYGKGMIVGDRHGFAKVIIDRATGLILAATAAGPQVAETGHLLQFAISRRLTIEEYLRLPHYHPTLAEAWQRAAEDAAAKR